VATTRQVHQWGYIYGAVGFGLARSEFLLVKTVDQAHFGHFYRRIAESDPASVHFLIQGGAGLHIPAGHEGLPDNVRIIALPPSNPEIKPVEGLWVEIKDSLCNSVLPSLSDRWDPIVFWLQSWVNRSPPRPFPHPKLLLLQANGSSRHIIPVS
jgi:hypothetical protein